MKVVVLEWPIMVFLIIGACGKNDYTLITDHEGNAPLSESVCYLSCLSNALNKLYTGGERRLLLNEEAYANASRILDDMEGRTGESVRYLSIISGSTEGKHDRLEKLISYGNAMGDLVAKAGGLFAEVNESVRAVRKEIPGALIKVNKYYTAIAEITRTVWDDVKAVEGGGEYKCEKREFRGVVKSQVTCGNRTCPLRDVVNDGALKHYNNGGVEINVQKGYVSECFNLPRDNLYRRGTVQNASDVLEWIKNRDEATRFQLKVQVQQLFGPLIATFAAGKPPSVILAMMLNITNFYNRFSEVHSNFTSLLLDTNITDKSNSTGSNI